MASRLRSAWSHRAVRIAALAVALALPVPAAVVLSHVYFDRSGLPDLEPFLRFEPLTIGTIYDSQGEPLIELAREHRRIISYDEIPLILRQAILAAEDKNYFSHSGVDYWALPRVVQKMAVRSWGAWRQDGASFRLMLPQGGSTLTQQLVRGYFLQERTSAENGDSLFRERSLHDEREPLRDDKKARTILRSESFSLRTMIRKNCSDVNALSH